MKLTTLLLIVFAIFVVAKTQTIEDELKGIEYLPSFLPYNVEGKKYCATEDVYRWKKAVRNSLSENSPLATCVTEGNCDVLEERNKWSGKSLKIPLHIIVLCNATACPGGVNQARVTDQVNQINNDYSGTGFSFFASNVTFHVDPTYAEIAAYGQSNLWYSQLLALKEKYAYLPAQYLNVFITGQKSGTSGTLLGIGTFPWDSTATGKTGGLWVNAAYVRSGDKTASHEIGHNIGLWHTFHGDSEVSCTNGCYETVHTETSDTSEPNKVGDFCADTPAQPMNYNCAYPTGSDCKGTRYNSIGNVPALINNIMAYTPDSCMQSITKQQSMRAHCWTCAKLKGWVTGQC